VQALHAVVLACLFLALLGLPGSAQTALTPPEQAAVQEKLEGHRAVVDSVEAGLGREGLRSEDLDGLRDRLDPVRTDLNEAVARLDPLLANLSRRVQEIGPKPAEGAPPEDASVTQERETLTAQLSALDAVVKQVRLLNVRADQMSDRITGQRRALFTDSLMARSYSVLNPTLWISAAAAVPDEVRGIGYLLRDWLAYADARLPRFGQIAVALGGVLIVVAVFVLRSMLARPLHRAELAEPGKQFSRMRASLLSALTALLRAGAAPLAAYATIALFNAFDVLPPRVNEVAQGIAFAVVILAVGRGLLDAALAPDEPRRRVMPLSGEIASLIYRNATLGVWMLAVAAGLQSIHRALVAPLPVTVATSALLAIALLLVSVRTIRALAAFGESDDADSTSTAAREAAAPGTPSPSTLQWIRFPFWIVNVGIVIALVGGYISVAVFLSSRALVAVVMAGAAYLVLSLINGVFIDAVASGSRSRSMAKTIGVRPASLELIAVLVAGVLKAIAVIFILVLVIGTFGTSTADIRDLVSRMTFGFTIGTSTITIGDVLGAVLFLAIGIVVARAVQRWVAVAILPKTTFDQGLQNSIATIIGYIGSITVIALAMGRLGLNLENIALVAGALSVGIGFGLQSIVSNFVSGLILLAERPIRVGDTINVKGEEGYVRRISVRATEIETFDRAAVVIPNSDLITGMVKNFTHANTTGRIIVAVNVSYDADADTVRDILIGCACDHPQVLQSPPPRVFLMAFGDSYLKFELRCVVANVDYALTVKSDLHFAVLERMKASHVGIPYTPWAVYRGGNIGPTGVPEDPNEEPAGEPSKDVVKDS